MHRHDASQGHPATACLARVFVGATAALLLMLPGPALASPRTWEPLILTGAQIPELIGADTLKLEVLAVNEGKLVPVPYQVDERRPDGRYALPYGPEPSADDSPGVLDADDEVVMMMSDLGPRAGVPASALLPNDALEIDVHDPLGGPDRYAYIAMVDNPKLTLKRYIAYQPKLDRIETDRYRLGFTKGYPTDYSPQTRMFADAPSIIERFQVQVYAVVLRIFPFHLTEDDVSNHLLAWKAGPVRVIRRLSHSVRLILGIHSPEVTSVDLFYRDYGENPFRVRFPWVPRLLFDDIHVRLNQDFRNLDGYTLSWSGMKGPPLVIGDRKAERQLESETAPRITWMAISGHGRTTIQTFVPTPDLHVLNFSLYYRNPDETEDHGCGHPEIGYRISGWERISSGVHRLVPILLGTNAHYDPRTVLRELHTPPVVFVRRAAEEVSARTSAQR